MHPADTMNAYQAVTSPSKLRGQFYTPPGLVELIFRSLEISRESLIVDPSCGDGAFLLGALAELHRRFPEQPPEYWMERIAGFEVHPAAAAEARERLCACARTLWGRSLPPEGFRVVEADVLRTPSRDALLRGAGVSTDGPLVIAGNPPYVEAKRLDAATKRDLAARFPEALSGAPDLYLYFLHACLGWLQNADRLAFVLPNKLLVSSNARAVRTMLLERNLLRGLWFATQTDAFNGAGVYPVVLFAGPGTSEPETARLRRDGERFDAYATARTRPELYAQTTGRTLFLPPESAAARQALEKLLEAPSPRLGQVLDVRWAVSFHRTGLRERFVSATRPESPHAQPFVGGAAFSGNGEVERYRLEWAGSWIDYDEDRLRQEGNCVPPLTLFRQPKIAICQNGRTLRAAYDESGAVLKDTFLAGLPEREHPLGRHPRALVGLLCSGVVHFFYSHVFFGGHVNGGYLHFLRSFLAEMPVGVWTDETAAKTADLVRAREAAGAAEALDLEDVIESRAIAALGLEPEEAEAINTWVDHDANWLARDRIRKAGRAAAAGLPGSRSHRERD